MGSAELCADAESADDENKEASGGNGTSAQWGPTVAPFMRRPDQLAGQSALHSPGLVRHGESTDSRKPVFGAIMRGHVCCGAPVPRKDPPVRSAESG